MKKALTYLCILGAVPACIALGAILWGNERYYLVSALALLLACAPVFFRFEKGAHTAREAAVMGAVIAAAVASRAAFFWLPQVKPIGAVAVICAAAFGPEAGFLCGAASMLLSNLLFGQGPWTPYQMFALGLSAFLCGLILRRGLRTNRFALALTGGLAVTLVYGLIADSCTVLLTVQEPVFSTVWPVYAAGLPFNLIFGGTTAVVLLAAGPGCVSALTRLRTKYGVFGGEART